MAITSETLAFERGVRPMMALVLPDKADEILSFNPDPDIKVTSQRLSTSRS